MQGEIAEVHASKPRRRTFDTVVVEIQPPQMSAFSECVWDLNEIVVFQTQNLKIRPRNTLVEIRMVDQLVVRKIQGAQLDKAV
jgi:hypothetical protein